jgi:hypothetical protein
MFITKERRKEFRPSGGFHGLEQCPVQLQPREHELEEARQADVYKKYSRIPAKSSLVDAESGESLEITKARWSTTEGRLSLSAQTILDMGTGKLEIRNRVKLAASSTATLVSSSIKNKNTYRPAPHSVRSGLALISSTPSSSTTDQSQSSPQARHPLINQFLEFGPLTPIFHCDWDPRSNTVKKTGSQLSSSTLDSTDVVPVTTSTGAVMEQLQFHRALNGNEVEIPTADPNIPLTSTALSNFNIIPTSISLNRQRNWHALLQKTFVELYALAEQLELNKSLTKENQCAEGLAAVRRSCQDLAILKVKAMKELVQAVDDEALKEAKREQYEFQNKDKVNLIADIKKKHRDERARGKQYLEGLQRDHEIMFMRRMKEAGLLW